MTPCDIVKYVIYPQHYLKVFANGGLETGLSLEGTFHTQEKMLEQLIWYI